MFLAALYAILFLVSCRLLLKRLRICSIHLLKEIGNWISRFTLLVVNFTTLQNRKFSKCQVPTARACLPCMQHKFNSNSQIVALFSDEMGFARHFFALEAARRWIAIDIPKVRNQSNRAKSTIVLYILIKRGFVLILVLIDIIFFLQRKPSNAISAPRMKAGTSARRKKSPVLQALTGQRTC